MVVVWDLQALLAGNVTGAKHFEGHGGDVDNLVFSPDSRLLASGSSDETVRVWDIVAGACLRVVGKRYGDHAAFSPPQSVGWQRLC